MSWWVWVLLWVVLVLAAAAFLYLAVRRLLRQGAALARELADAADRLADVSRVLEELGEEGPGHAAAPTRAAPERPRRPGRRQDVR